MGIIRRKVIDWLGRELSAAAATTPGTEELAERVVWAEAARETCASYVSACLAGCEFRFLGEDGRPELDRAAWLWNVSPNPVQSRAELVRAIVRRMLVETGEAVVVPVGAGESQRIYLADSYSRRDVPGSDTVYTSVSVQGSTEVAPRSMLSGELYVFRAEESSVLRLMRSMDAAYDELAATFASSSRSRNASQWLLTLDQSQVGTGEQQERVREQLQANVRRFVRSQNAVMPLYRGQSLQKLSTDSTRGSNGSASDLISVRKDAYEMVAESMRIPVSLLYGNTNNFAEVFNAFLTVAVDDKARAMAEEISRKTYPLEEWRKGRRVVIDTTHVRHVDVFAVAQQAQALVGSGIDCPNEVRALTGQPPIPEGWADSYQMTLNNQTLGGGPDGAA